ncbi:ethylene-responsive transcription factor ERF [Forsythia ovata]|uniref:Ethylene-responsive transcription factor ERF n=1 Tax=Forsythia ovata TaxID=205694 RepID=A0ABD1VHQ0_9LAMI
MEAASHVELIRSIIVSIDVFGWAWDTKNEIRLPNSRERIWLGSYDTAEKATKAFDAALFYLRGSHAKFNFPDDPPNIAGGQSLTPVEIQVVAQHTTVESNANDLVSDGKSQEVKVDNGGYSSSNLNAISSGFSAWNMDFNRMNLNYSVHGTKSLSDPTMQIRFEIGSGTNFSTKVDSNANDLVLADKSLEVKAENGFHSGSNLNVVSTGFSEWNLDFNEMNLNSHIIV